MLLQNDVYTVNVSVDTTYTINSMDNKPYNIILNPVHLKRNDFYKVFHIRIDSSCKVLHIALIGSFYSDERNCAVLEQEILTVLQNDIIIQLNVKDGSVVNFKKLDDFGCNFGIYKVCGGYVIHGEMEIVMLDSALNIVWSFIGKDIFVTQGEEKAFELCHDSIKLYDFNCHYYELDFSGKIINRA